MKADFEKGTKICSRCKKELPIEMFCNDRSKVDGLYNLCKQCEKKYKDETQNTFRGELEKNAEVVQIF